MTEQRYYGNVQAVKEVVGDSVCNEHILAGWELLGIKERTESKLQGDRPVTITSIVYVLGLAKGREIKPPEDQANHTITLEPSIPEDNTLITKFLIPRILEPHREKHNIHYEFAKNQGLVTALTLPFTTAEEHVKEIRNAVQWACKKYSETKKEAVKT